MAAPVEPADRVEALDVLRGVALFGVLTVNLVTIFRHSLFEEFLHGPEDAWARAVSFGLEFKAVTLFSLLFGIGLEAQRERIDGLNVIAFAMFAIAAMDGIPAHFMAAPLLVAALTGLAFLLALGQMVITALVFGRAGGARAFAIGLIAGNRNIGLMLAATGFMVPDVAWLYFALAQFPIYLLPHLLKPLARRLTANH